ncbi:MAG: hypothetical protein IPJ65_42580 [Archangiaceae bacterium]|nr:hypothetical protein [Archangiaceae bacterium]
MPSRLKVGTSSATPTTATEAWPMSRACSGQVSRPERNASMKGTLNQVCGPGAWSHPGAACTCANASASPTLHCRYAMYATSPSPASAGTKSITRSGALARRRRSRLRASRPSTSAGATGRQAAAKAPSTAASTGRSRSTLTNAPTASSRKSASE